MQGLPGKVENRVSNFPPATLKSWKQGFQLYNTGQDDELINIILSFGVPQGHPFTTPKTNENLTFQKKRKPKNKSKQRTKKGKIKEKEKKKTPNPQKFNQITYKSI